MLDTTRQGAAEAEIAAARVEAGALLPRLLGLRQQLEREAGVLDAAGTKRRRIILACACAAALVGAWALWSTIEAEPPIVAWVLTALLAGGAIYMQKETLRLQGPRARDLEALHARMLSVGRQIDRAERLLRDEPRRSS
jgi:hypothetical protein